jgi:O-antigen ligase
MVLFLGLQAIASNKATVKGLKSVATFRLLIALWTFVGLVGSFFVQNLDVAMRNLLPLFLGFILGYVFITAKDFTRVLNSLQTGWVVAFVITGLLAVREMVTGLRMSNYLPSYNSTELARVDPELIASIFGNPNAYAAFLVTTFAFLVNGLLKSEARFVRYCYIGMILALCVLILSTGSRLCLFALILEMIVFASYAGRRYRNALAGASMLVLLSLVLVGSGVTDSLASQFPGKLSSSTPSKILLEAVSSDSTSSGGARLNLYKDGLWMVGNSAGLGVGPGNFEVVMASGDVPYDSGRAVDPHNLYLEIVSQYGLFVFLAFVLWVAACFRACWGGARRTMGEERSWGVAMVAGVAGNAVSSLANSSYLSASINWVFMATLLLVAVTIERGADNKALALMREEYDASCHLYRHSLDLDDVGSEKSGSK